MTMHMAVAVLSVAASLGAAPNPHAATDAWLRAHHGFRLATAADCGCAESLSQVPEIADPYRVVGDFDGDGTADEAVVVVNQADPQDYRVLVFASRFDHGRSPLVYARFFDGTLLGVVLTKSKYSSAGRDILLLGAIQSEAEPIYLPSELPRR